MARKVSATNHCARKLTATLTRTAKDLRAARRCFKPRLYSGVGRETFKRLTGLEARLFMRGDAKVFVHCGRMGFNQARDYLLQNLPRLVQSSIPEIAKRAKDAVVDEDMAWRKNVSAWWLMNASGMAVPPAGE